MDHLRYWKKVGLVAYKLKLPLESKIHFVFHKSCRKKHLGPHVTPIPLLPMLPNEEVCVKEPETVLKRRIYKKGNAAGV